MRPPNDEEFIDILRTYCGAAPGGLSAGEAAALLTSARITVADDYVSDTPGYCGRVALILHSGGPECVEVVTWSESRKPSRRTAAEWT